MRHTSVATLDAPRFINLRPNDINKGISECEIKVMYLGENRNGSFISEEAAISMSKTLRGAPIVASYNKEKGDFGDHGGHIGFDENGKPFITPDTVPYGFVAPNAEVWFKDFAETGSNGEPVTRTYLMTTGFLWTGQYPEITKVITEGRGHSMELDSDTMDGEWSTNDNGNVDIFIVNDAEFTKLCILGEDVEPCFEGSSVTSPKVSKEFGLDDPMKSLFTMMYELKTALEEGAGMEDEILDPEQQVVEEEIVEEAAATEEGEVEEFACGEEEFEKKDEEDESKDESDESKEAAPESEEDEDEEEKPAKNHSVVEEAEEVEEPVVEAVDYSAIIPELESLRSEVAELRQFKLNVENAEKDALIAKYFMLSEEDKKEVLENKESYSLEQIEAKLALAYVRANVNFESVDGNVEDAEEVEEDPITSFSLDDNAGFVPPVVSALRKAAQC